MKGIFIFICLVLLFINASEGNPVPTETEIKHFWHGRCHTHRECVCLTGLPLCHEGFCLCVYGSVSQFGYSEEIIDNAETTPDTEPENIK